MKNKLIQWFLRERQMSEAFINSIFLAMSGGFQDAYTYFARGGVYSNAQTGNKYFKAIIHSPLMI